MESDNTRGTNVAAVRKSDPDASSAKIWEVESAYSGITVLDMGVGERNLTAGKSQPDSRDASYVSPLRTVRWQACLF